jgi:hypothetical protein
LSWRRPDCGRGIKVSAHIPSWGRDGATRTSQAPHPPRCIAANIAKLPFSRRKARAKLLEL